MRETTENPKKKHICIGMLAHVDAGKTTLTESILYLTGTIRKLGRVDHKDAFLDTDQIERERGITVFSKEARFTIDETDFTLLDTPGHADFSTEMERTLQVLDYGILIVSGADGIQGHTITLWRLLTAYQIPVFVFVNKMDQPGTEKAKILAGLRENLGDGFLDFDRDPEGEDLALCSEKLMESYFATERITEEQIAEAVRERKVYPVVFGSALKLQGTERFLEVLKRFAQTKEFPEAFSARVYKITRDKQGVRQTHMKITGGSLRSKMMLSGENSAHQPWEEKADQIRLYSGNSFQLVQEVNAGMVCTVTGLTQTYAGEGLGTEQRHVPLLEPAMTCHILLPSEVDSVVALHKLRELEEEDPMLRFVWKEESKEIHVQVMGELELEILQRRIRDRFQWNVTFGEGSLLYKETIIETSIGIGHFEPLRHYAEVHLLLEPGEKGSGLIFDSICSEDKLDRNWQRLIITHLQERQHPGILTGSPITDMKITLVAGRAHLKHTEGGDFRQATYRAVRQGLRKAECVLLEPVYDFRLEIPTDNVGRALADIQRLGGTCGLPELGGDHSGYTVIRGQGPVATLRSYSQEVSAYTKGMGKFIASMAGYAPCHNQEEVIASLGYLPERDLENPTGSVFCDHGGAVLVPWDQVDAMAHLDSGFALTRGENNQTMKEKSRTANPSVGEKELEEIFLRTYGKSKRDEELLRQRQLRGTIGPKRQEHFPALNWKVGKQNAPFLIIDGYNVIFAWEELHALAKTNLDAAREAFLEILGNYQGYKKMGIIVVFDGYKVTGNTGTKQDYGEIQVVYTPEAETADCFIEKTIYEKGKQYQITVVTSDLPVQMAALGDGAVRMSAREFYQEVISTSEEIRQKLKRQRTARNRPFEGRL